MSTVPTAATEPDEPSGPGLPAAVEARIATYTPDFAHRRMSEQQWAAWAPLLRARVRASNPNVNTAGTRMSIAAGLLDWALTQRLPLGTQPEVLWRDTTHQRYLAARRAASPTATKSERTVASILRTLASALPPVRRTGAPTAPTAPAPAPTSGQALLDARTAGATTDLGLPDAPRYWALLRQVRSLVAAQHPDALTAGSATPGRNGAVPYGDVELARLLRASSSIRTPRTREATRALLALGAGAGLGGLEVANVVGHDLADDPATGRLTVTVRSRTGSGARLVPVLDVWEQLLRRLAAQAGERRLLGGGNSRGGANRPNQLGTALASADRHAVRADSTRLRATWLVTHLAGGTPLPLLLRLANVKGVATLDPFLAYTPVPALTTAVTSWTGPAEQATP